MNSGVKPDTLSPTQLQRLGLDTEPFNPEPPAGRPFRDGAIDTQVNVALHILQHTDQVLLVQGAAGLGKTAFLALLNQASGEELVLIHLHPGMGSPESDVYRAIAEAGGIDNADETSAVSALLRLADMGQRPVLLLDDADRVPREAIECLLALHATMSQHHATPGIVLAASRDLVPLISARAREGGLEPHLINLHPLDEEQTREYIRHRLRQAGSLDGEQLNESQCRQIHHRTRGNPANINREASRLLAAAVPVTGPAATTARKPNRWLLPVVIVAVAVLVGGLIAASYLVEPGGESGMAETPEPAAQTPRASERQPPALPNRKTLEEKLRAAQSDAAGQGQAPAAGTDQAGEGDGAMAPDTGAATPPQDGASASQTVSGAGDDNAEPSGDETSGTDGSDSGAPTGPAATGDEPDAVTLPETTGASTAAKAPDTSGADKAGSSASGTQAKAAEAEQASGPPPANHYTIQLIGAYDRGSLDDFIDEMSLAEEPRIVTTRRDGRDWHVVVYGNYASRDSAQAALQELPSKAREYGAWVRSFGSLR